jgi:hypothetical protein
MAVTTKDLLRLLDSGRPLEVRAAALLVLAELGVREAAVTEAVTACLEEGEPALRLRAIEAAGKLRIESALPLLIDRIKEGGPASERAALAVAQLGARGTRTLQDLMPRVAPGLRRTIAAALAAAGTTSAETATVEVLLDRDAGVVEAAVRSLIAQIPTLTPKHRKAWNDQLLGLLEDKKTDLSPVSEAAVVRLLAGLDDPRSQEEFWERILPPHPTEVRTVALQALGKWAQAPTKEQLRRLLRCALEKDFHLAAPALVLLKHVPVNGRSLAEWLSLLEAPDVAVRQLAIDRVGDQDRADVAAALVAQLHHPDRALRDKALVTLSRLEHGRRALTEALFAAETADEAWSLARAQAPLIKSFAPRWRDEVFTQACRHLEAEDRRSDPLLFLLRESDPADLRERLEERSLAWRKKKNYAAALLYLRLLLRDPAAGLPLRLEGLACGLKVSGHDLAVEARTSDPALQQAVHLAKQHGEELFEPLEKTKWLEPEDLYYLGFHLAEQPGAARRLGGKVLQLVLKRSPRSKVAQAARSKLRSAALD